MKSVFALLFLSVAYLASTTGVSASKLFSDCKFGHGVSYASDLDSATSNPFTHVSVWVGGQASYNQYWEGRAAEYCQKFDCTLVVYGYVIAEYGKANYGLSDCDVNPYYNLCTHGANVIRNDWAQIINRYKTYASNIANILGSKVSIWLIEPDFLQYSALGDELNTQNSQVNGAIPNSQLATTYFNDIRNAIKQYLPNAKIGVDISPWLNNRWDEWYGNFEADKVDLLFTSGGDTRGDTAKIRDRAYNDITWAQAASTFGGKPVLADDGYGAGGGYVDNYSEWLQISNVSERKKDNVMGITIQHQNPSSLAPQVSAIKQQACSSN